ncbi:MAG TPA: GntR family transcriptional regulator [Burkholderiales bacterium]|nr:GntR family transcriptional regulator [Burkholderiales bacterium]
MERIDTTGRISDTVYGILRNAILSHELKSGESLSIPELARKLGVSRTPVRDAVLQLVAEGLAASEPRKGATVLHPDEESLLAIHEVREVLEGLSVRRAAQAISASQIRRLDQILKNQAKAVGQSDVTLFSSTDEAFHELIADVNPEPRLSQFLRILRDQMQLAVTVATANPQHLREAHREHVAIFSALSKQDAKAAERAMRLHISRSRARVASALAGPALNTGSARSETPQNARRRKG